MNTEEVARPGESAWFKSSHSGDQGGNCVEVAVLPGVVRVRDAKDRGCGTLAVAPAAWSAFVAFAAAEAVAD